MYFFDLQAAVKKRGLPIGKIKKAYHFAKAVHAHQKRKSGEPYIIHPVSVAQMLCRVGCDEETIIVGLLHDTIEDSLNPQDTRKKIVRLFGERIFFSTEAMSKCSYTPKAEKQEKFFQQIQESVLLDDTALFVKMADLCHNLATLDGLKPEKKSIWLAELKDRYIPIFQTTYHRLLLSSRPFYTELMEKLFLLIETHEQHPATR